MATAVTSMRIPTELNERYSRLAKETGRSRSFYVNEALQEAIDRFEYEYGILKDIEDYRAVAWRIDFTRNADKAMRKLDKGVAARVFDELDEIAKLEDPRSRGKALTGNLAGVWRYRVGDYRILCDINDGRLVILVVDVAHRREVYKRR